MFMRHFATAAMLLTSTHLFAQTIDAELSDKSARFNYATEAWGKQYGRVEVEGGVLFNNNSDYAVNVGMHVYNDSYDSPLELGVGGRIYYAHIDNGSYNTAALALGVKFHFAPQALHGVGIGANYYYAPKIVTFMDADHFVEYGAKIDYQLMPQANVYLGYRRLRSDIEHVGYRDVQKGGFIGVQIRY